jgi:hypothetical protein
VRKTLYNNCLVKPALPSAARTNAVVNGTTVDVGVFANDFRTVMFIVSTATITDGSHAFTMQDSPDGTTWTAVPAAKRQGSLPTVVAADDDTLFTFGYVVDTNQYVRLVVTTTGATTGGVFSAVAVMSEGTFAPVARA